MHKGLNGFGNNLIIVKASDDKSDKVKKDKKDRSTRGGGIAADRSVLRAVRRAVGTRGDQGGGGSDTDFTSSLTVRRSTQNTVFDPSAVAYFLVSTTS